MLCFVMCVMVCRRHCSARLIGPYGTELSLGAGTKTSEYTNMKVGYDMPPVCQWSLHAPQVAAACMRLCVSWRVLGWQITATLGAWGWSIWALIKASLAWRLRLLALPHLMPLSTDDQHQSCKQACIIYMHLGLYKSLPIQYKFNILCPKELHEYISSTIISV